MVLSYLTSYVYSGSSGSSSNTTASTSPVPSRHNSVRRYERQRSTARGPRGGSSSSSHSSKGKGRARSGDTIYEDADDEKRWEHEQDKERNERTPLKHDDPALAVIDYINTTRTLYDVVGISNKFTSNDELRRAYMARCRVCHPDKFPHYSEQATAAFQRVSLAYETLSKPTSRRAYDLSGSKTGGYQEDTMAPDFGDETLHSVLYTMYCEFLEKGDFEMVRVLVEALNASNPGLNLGEDAIEGIEGALGRLRSILLSGAKHFRIVKFELIRLYEIQHDLRQLSYFDVFGRLRLSLQLARVTLSIPMAIDKAMKEDNDDDDDGDDGEDGQMGVGRRGFVEDGEANEGRMVKRGLLGPRIASVLGLAVNLLEKGERII